MSRSDLHILLIDSSQIITRGLATLLSDAGVSNHVVTGSTLGEWQHHFSRQSFELVIISPIQCQMETKTYHAIRNDHPEVKWVGLIYTYVDPQLLSTFDGLIHINDSTQTILKTLQRIAEKQKATEADTTSESLSDRETEVLKLLVTGLSNKEIADRLNISSHTVITHRKNISQKTGIKSVSGLTVYAVVKGILSIEGI